MVMTILLINRATDKCDQIPEVGVSFQWALAPKAWSPPSATPVDLNPWSLPSQLSSPNFSQFPTEAGTTNESRERANGQFSRSGSLPDCKSCQTADSIRQEMHLHSAIRDCVFSWEPNRRKKAQKRLHPLIPATVPCEPLRLRRRISSGLSKCIDQRDLTQG